VELFEEVTISFSKRFRVEHCNTFQREGLNPFLALPTCKVPLISK